MRAAGVGLGQLLLALGTTVVGLIEAPRGVGLPDAPRGRALPVASAALIDADDVRLGLGRGADSADVFFLLGVADSEAQRWIDTRPAGDPPAALFAKETSDA